MLRFVSLIGVTMLALAALTRANQTQPGEEETQPRSDATRHANRRLVSPRPLCLLSYHARFSLN